MSLLSEVLAAAAAFQKAKDASDMARPQLREARQRFERAVSKLLEEKA